MIGRLTGITIGALILTSCATSSSSTTSPDHRSRPAYREGNRQMIQENFERARTLYTRAIERSPDFARAYEKRGITHLKQNNLDDAISDFTRSIEQNPEYPNAYNNRGLARLEQGQYQNGISDFTRAIQLRKNYVMPRFNRARAYHRTGAYEAGLNDITHAIEESVNDPSRAYIVRGDLYYALNRNEKAIEDYTESFRQEENFEAAIKLGQLHHQNHHDQKALHWLNRAAELRPEDRELLRIRADVYEQLGMEDQIEEIKQKLNELERNIEMKNDNETNGKPKAETDKTPDRKSPQPYLYSGEEPVDSQHPQHVFTSPIRDVPGLDLGRDVRSALYDSRRKRPFQQDPWRKHKNPTDFLPHIQNNQKRNKK